MHYQEVKSIKYEMKIRKKWNYSRKDPAKETANDSEGGAVNTDARILHTL
jgi:hypothetical protein